VFLGVQILFYRPFNLVKLSGQFWPNARLHLAEWRHQNLATLIECIFLCANKTANYSLDSTGPIGSYFRARSRILRRGTTESVLSSSSPASAGKKLPLPASSLASAFAFAGCNCLKRESCHSRRELARRKMLSSAAMQTDRKSQVHQSAAC
jgi:hypothetical protein